MSLPLIAAISTPYGRGAISLVRVSGEGLDALCRRVFVSKAPLCERVATYGKICDPTSGEVIDDGVAVLYRAPHSYTGEDLLELSCHGGTVVTGRVLVACLDAGARMAEAGEFTRRAFAAGKLTLSGAEGIMDLIDARSVEASRLARKTASGALSRRLDALSAETLSLCAALCAVMDYPDESLESLGRERLEARLSALEGDLSALCKTLSVSRAVMEGIPAYVIGRPNVGKSSFFNALLGEDRAIVTQIAGTTRDMIEYPLSAGRLLLRLTDTAGLRECADTVERLGIERTRQALTESAGCVVFALFDGATAQTDEDAALIEFVSGLVGRHTVVPVLNKSDLPRRFDESALAALGEVYCCSALTQTDFSALFSRLEQACISDYQALETGAVLTNARQYDCVRRAAEAVREALCHLSEEENDLCVTFLEEALGALRQADGREVSGLVADEIFRRFCVGK